MTDSFALFTLALNGILLGVGAWLLAGRCARLETRLAHMEGYLSALKTSPTAPAYVPPPTPAQTAEALKRAEEMRAEWQARDREVEALLRRELDIPIDMPIGRE